MKRARGFTLLEVLLAVSIVVMLTATMAATISVSFNLKKGAERAVDSVRDMRTIGDIWVTDMMNVVQPSVNSTEDAINNAAAGGTTGTTGTNVASGGAIANGSPTGLPYFLFGPFLGSPTSISMYVTGSERNSTMQGGVCYVQYAMEQQKDGTWALVRRVETNMLSGVDPTTFPSGLPEEIMVTNVNDISFQYDDGADNWADNWDSTNTNNGLQLSNVLPYAVQMTLTLNPANPNDPNSEVRTIKRYAMITCAPAADATAQAAANAAAAAAGGGAP